MFCKYAAPHLRKVKGSIVIISSTTANLGQTQAASYAASKSGQLGLMRALALDFAKEGVRVNAVCPSCVMTPLMREWADTLDDPKGALAMLERYQPVGRMAEIEEIGEVCAFLASNEASFITGQFINADGGAGLGYGDKYGA
jgi:NAD(P)-dependent dehydrogenase (short-subunit alcohol dehydrogenase family)